VSDHTDLKVSLSDHEELREKFSERGSLEAQDKSYRAIGVFREELSPKPARKQRKKPVATRNKKRGSPKSFKEIYKMEQNGNTAPAAPGTIATVSSPEPAAPPEITQETPAPQPPQQQPGQAIQSAPAEAPAPAPAQQAAVAEPQVRVGESLGRHWATTAGDALILSAFIVGTYSGCLYVRKQLGY
jgi:hypothetical protein